MKYLCLVFVDEKKLTALSASEAQSLDDESLASDDTLRQGGHLIAAQAGQAEAAGEAFTAAAIGLAWPKAKPRTMRL